MNCYVGHPVFMLVILFMLLGHLTFIKSSPPRRWGVNFGVIGAPVKTSLEWGNSPCGLLTEKQLSGGTPLLSLKI